MQAQNTDPNFKIPPALRHRSLNRRQAFNGPSGTAPAGPASLEPPNPPKRSRFHFLDPRRKWSSLRTRHKVIVIFAALLVVSAGGLISRSLLSGGPSPSIDINKNEEKITTVQSPLTGVQVDPGLAKRPVTGIMIENSLEARPQSGIQDAGVVFEAIAEGGITRFLSLYQEGRPGYIGPVRSLRPYYIDWAASFDAPIAHVGGSPDALAQIRNGGKALDQFFNGGSYWREAGRTAPHNVYTSFDKMDELNKSKGYTTSTFIPWPRKADEKLAVPSAKTIDLSISSANFNVHYDYGATTNNYARSQGGAGHGAVITPNDKTTVPIVPKVVVVMIMPFSIVDSSGHSGYGTQGSGNAYVFQDGGVTTGTWTKADKASQIVFKDTADQPIKLNAGLTWVTALKNDGQVKYSP